MKGREDHEVMVFRCLTPAREIQQAFGTEHRLRKEEVESDVEDLAQGLYQGGERGCLVNVHSYKRKYQREWWRHHHVSSDGRTEAPDGS